MNRERVTGIKVEYWSVNRNGFTAGCHYGTGQSDNAVHYSMDELLDSQNKNFLSHLPPNISAKELFGFLLDELMNDDGFFNQSGTGEYIARIKATVKSL
jgi:hypothetical protein